MVTKHVQQLDFHNTNLYGYTPTKWVGFVFIIIFGLSTAWHVVQGVRSRLWWLFWTIVLAGMAETIGWFARLLSSFGATRFTPYLIQNMMLILAPIPLVAASFIILGQIIRRLGQEYSRLNAKWYARIFVSCDIIALMIQGGGGGIVSTNAASGKDTALGTNIILAGIIFQTFAITIYIALASEFIIRYLYRRPVRSRASPAPAYPLDREMKRMLYALVFSSLCVYVRSWYRTIEFAGGYNGPIVHTERYFVVMDAVMIALAIVVMNVCHPGQLLGPSHTWTEDAIERREKEQIIAGSSQGVQYSPYEAIRLHSDERV